MSKAQQENSDREDPVDVYMKVVDPKTRKVLFDSGNSFPSTDVIVRSFLKQHNKDLSSDNSGYAGDISDDSSGRKSTDGVVRPRWTLGSAVSTISGGIPPASLPSTRDERLSTVSTGTSSPNKGMKRPNRSLEPILTSTKIDDSIVNAKPSVLSDSRSSKSSLSNGELLAGVSISLSSDSTSTPPELKEATKADDINGALVPRGRKRRKNSKTTSESSEEKLNVSGQANQAKRQKKGTEIFDSSSNEESMSVGTSASSDVNNDISIKPEPVKAQFLESPACGSRVMTETESTKLARSQTLWGSIAIGEWVFARWRDKNYYSGQITEKGQNDTWRIHFEDNMDDVASETHILPIKIIGKDVTAVYSPDNIYRPSLATVVGQIIIDKDRAEYAIKCTDLNETLICQRKQLSIKESEAKELRKQLHAAAPKAADLSLDNIMAGPRRRAGLTPITPQSASRKIVGGAFDASSADDSVLRDSGAGTPAPRKPPTLNKPMSSKSSSTSTDLNSSSTVSNKSITSTPSIMKTPSTHKDPSNKDTPKGSKAESAKKSSKSKDKGLFDGFQFFLTASGGGDPSSAGADIPVSLPYDKDEYKESIETRGGKVVESVGREKGRDNVYLISDSHARTVKYIYCLAAGIPCVSHQWIEKCLDSKTIVPWKEYELKSGFSLEAEQVIPAHQKKPLKNLKIFVTAETDELYNYWKPVLTAAEATLLKPKKKGSASGIVPSETEVVVTDSSCSQEVYDKVTASNIPMVKPEWLVQTIITGRKASYDGHERYRIIPGNEYGDEDE